MNRERKSNGERILSEPVSVIIPFSRRYTPESMLKEAVESVDKQSIPTKIIIINDKNERGPAWARNRGIEEAETRFIAFLDADDLWTNDKLKRQIIEMQQQEVGLCVEGNDMNTDTFIHKILDSSIGSLTSSILINTSRISVTFRTDLERFEDHLFLIEAAIEGGICFCNNLTIIRKREGGLSSEGTLEMWYKSRIEMAEIIEREIPRAQPYISNIRGLAHYSKGRNLQKQGQYKRALLHLMKSFRNRVHYKPIMVFLLCILEYCVKYIRKIYK